MNIKNNIKKNQISEYDVTDFIVTKTVERSVSQTCLNAYALTVNYKNRNTFQNKNSISELRSINRRFRKMYFELCKFQFGKKIRRKLKFQTQVHSFIDVSGTRFHARSTEHLGDNPHIHAVVIPDKSEASKWADNSYLEEIRSIFAEDTLVESVVLEQIDNMDGLKKFTGYASKFYVPNASSQEYSDQLYCIYPDFTKSSVLFGP